VASSHSFSKAAVEGNTSDESNPMDFDNEVAESIAHLDASPHLIHKVDVSSLSRSSRTSLPVSASMSSDDENDGEVVMTKTLASVTIRLLIILLFEHAHLTAFGNPLLHLHMKSQHLSSPMHRLLKCNPLSNC